MTKIFAFIFARGGSKGLPRKNILPIAGTPLLAYSIKLAKQINQVERIFVSTDDEEIASIAIQYGAIVINRPKELAKDDSPEWLAWQHAIQITQEKYGLFDCFLSMPCTSPLRTKEDVENCISAFNSSSDMVVGISPLNKSPSFNIVMKDQDNSIKLLNSDSNFSRRQDAPVAYEITTVAYVSSPGFILRSKCIWDGKVKGIEIPRENSIDIDTNFDFQYAKYLLEAKKCINDI